MNRSKSNQTATYSYDGLRRLSSVTEPRVGTTSITYHTEAGKIGLRACVTDPAGNATTYDYDSSSGRLLWEKNALNQYTRYAYNSFGRQTMIWGDTQYPVTLGYDAYGQQISLKTYRTGDAWNSASWPGASLAGDQTTWTYDAASGLVTAKTDAAGNATTYTYTTDGRLASRTWARQVNGEPLVTTFSYNAFGSLLKVDYSDATPDITITYNRIGQPVTVQDAAGTRNFAYNANLGLISETVSGIYNKTLTRTYTTTFGKGKVLSMSIGNVNNYTYDYDTYGRLNKIATPAGDFTYTRPADSNLITAMARPNGVNSSWSFEEHRNLLSQVANGSVSTYTYTNDALGRRTNVARMGAAFANVDVLSYGYNSRSEVISALSNINANYNFAYSYDPIGNRLNSTLAGTAWSYTSNDLNQYTALTSGNTTQSPAYDADGNMTFRDGWTQVWNGENRLVEMYNDTTKLTFSYDYMGRRIEKKVFQQTGGIWAPQKSLQYVYDGYKLVEEIDTLPDEKPVIRRYTWQPESQGADLPLVVTDVASNQSYFYTADGNKNISELVDAAGNVAAHYEYDPFGKINTQNGAYAASNPFRFSSEYFDDETGLVYYNYRYYSPTMGRWINRDPIGEAISYNLFRSNIFQFAIERPPSFSIKATKMKNSYLILLNDPIMMFDHLGLLEMNVCCDNAQLMWPLNYLRHCEISLGACPSGRDWVTYPIKVDVSKDRKMDNGISCACANEQDIKNCMKRHPYSAGNGTWGSNCQTSVIKTLANCCLSTTWSPNLYAGSPRGACKKYTSIITPDGIPIAVCIEWEYPEWRK